MRASDDTDTALKPLTKERNDSFEKGMAALLLFLRNLRNL
jgi:hypothetical protein